MNTSAVRDPLLAHFELLADGLDPCPSIEVSACSSVDEPRQPRVIIAGVPLTLAEAEGLAGKIVRAVMHARRMALLAEVSA